MTSGHKLKNMIAHADLFDLPLSKNVYGVQACIVEFTHRLLVYGANAMQILHRS